jgi:hypothetical protein
VFRLENGIITLGKFQAPSAKFQTKDNTKMTSDKTQLLPFPLLFAACRLFGIWCLRFWIFAVAPDSSKKDAAQ